MFFMSYVMTSEHLNTIPRIENLHALIESYYQVKKITTSVRVCSKGIIFALNSA